MMKKVFVGLPGWRSVTVLLPVFIFVFNSCDILGIRPEGDVGELRIAFASGQEVLTRAGLSIPDTSDFILTVTDSKGNAVYDGLYGDCPESLMLEAGTYSVSVISAQFSKPAFSAPQFGDEQCVVVPSGGAVDLKLVCRQKNAGIRLKIDPGFLTAYPDGVLLLKAASGRLVYGYSEKRIAYFKPGSVSLILNEGIQDKLLVTKELSEQEVLDLKVLVAGAGSSSQESSGHVSVSVDTTRNWLSETYVIGGENDKGDGVYDALSVAQAIESAGEEDVWVCGYIVGGDLSSSSASFDKPFSSRTNLLLGPRSSTSSRTSCMSVQLQSGAVRDALNLVDNPDLLGRKVCVRGDIVEAYYGLPGIKNITEYELQ